MISSITEEYKIIKGISDEKGKAYLCQCRQDKTLCVIKEIKFSYLTRKEKEAVIRDMNLLSKIDHMNIIKYKKAQETENKNGFYIVMNFAEGGNLSQQIKSHENKGNIQESLILDWFYQMCVAVKYCHDRNIIHRNIKPSNFLLTKDLQIQLADFGNAKLIEKGKLHTCTGTPAYIAPEMWKDEPYDFKVDVWGLGVILYELCTLKPPFIGKDLHDLFSKIIKGQYKEIPKGYSKQMRSLVANIIQTKPKNRPSVDEILKMAIFDTKKNIPIEKKQDNINQQQQSQQKDITFPLIDDGNLKEKYSDKEPKMELENCQSNPQKKKVNTIIIQEINYFSQGSEDQRHIKAHISNQGNFQFYLDSSPQTGVEQQLQNQEKQNKTNLQRILPRKEYQELIEADFPIQCLKINCNQKLIRRICLSPTCNNFRLICDSQCCWRDHQEHMDQVELIQSAEQYVPSLIKLQQQIKQKYEKLIDQKTKEFIVALEASIKIIDTPIFQALEQKPTKIENWNSSDWNNFVLNLSQIVNDKQELEDLQANKKIQKLDSFNIKDLVEKLRYYNQLKRFQNKQNEFRDFQTQSLLEQQKINIFSNFSIIKSHHKLLFNSKNGNKNIVVSNSNQTLNFPLEINNLIILPQNLTTLNENKIHLLLEFEGDLGKGFNKFGLFCGPISQCTYMETNHFNNLFLMSDSGYNFIFGVQGEKKELELQQRQCQLGIILDKEKDQVTFTNQKVLQFVTLPFKKTCQELYFCVILSSGGNKVTIL